MTNNGIYNRFNLDGDGTIKFKKKSNQNLRKYTNK